MEGQMEDPSVLYYLTLDGPQTITLKVSCEPICSFHLEVPVSKKIHQILEDIEEKIKQEKKVQIRVSHLHSGDSTIQKALPEDYAVGDLLEDGNQVSVDFRQFDSPDTPAEGEDYDEYNATKPKKYRCPYKFSGLYAHNELKEHLTIAKIGMKATENWSEDPNLNSFAEVLQCPLVFDNESDACKHIEAVIIMEQNKKKKLKKQGTRTIQKRLQAELHSVEQNERKKQIKKKQQQIRSMVISFVDEAVEIVKQKQEKRKEIKLFVRSIVLSIIKNITAKEQEKKESSINHFGKRSKVKLKKTSKSKNNHQNKEITPISQELQDFKPKRPQNKKPNEVRSNPLKSLPNIIPKTPPEILVTHKLPSQNFKSTFYPFFLSKLNEEIDRYVNNVQKNVRTQFIKAESMKDKIKTIVNSLWPNARVVTYGSYETKLCIPQSDLDLMIIGGKRNGESPFHTLYAQIKTQKWLKSCTAIETARFPVIKLTSKEEDLPTDITFDGDDVATFITSEGLLVRHSGLNACEFIEERIKQNPEIVPLTIILKSVLYQENLNNTQQGGLSSYCLVLMIISFLQHRRRNEQLEEQNLGILLLDFLEFYGKNFDFQKTGISVSSAGSYFSLEEAAHKYSHMSLVIVDPFNPSNNVAKHVAGMKTIKTLWAEMHRKLKEPFYSTFTPAESILQRVLKIPSS